MKLTAVDYGGQIYAATDGGKNWDAKVDFKQWTGAIMPLKYDGLITHECNNLPSINDRLIKSR